MTAFQLMNRAEIRASIVRAIGGIAGTATGGGDTSSLIDTYALQGADDEHNGRMVYMTKVAGAAATDKTWVSDFAGSTSDATLSPVVSGIIASGDTYEMYPRPFNVDDINESINRAISDVTGKALIDRVTDDNFTQSGLHEYDWLVPYAFGLDFKAVYNVEYVYDTGTERLLHNCDAVWAELVDADVTASLDTSIQREGSGCLKLVVAAGAGAGDILATASISSTDIYDCDQIEIWIRSSVALAAGDLQVLLDNTASCASPLESLDIPATSANTWTRHVIDLANAPNDAAIISVGIKMVTDKGAFTLYVDDVVASLSDSKEYKELNPEYWSIMRADTAKLKLTAAGLNIVGANNQVRLSGYCAPDIFSDDTTDSDVDPAYIIEWVLADIMLNNAKSRALDIDNRADLGKFHLMMAEKKRREITITPRQGTVFV